METQHAQHKRKKNHLSDQQMQNLKDELYLNLHWCGYYVCNPKDEDNMLLGIYTAYQRRVNYDHAVKESLDVKKFNFTVKI